MSPGREGLGNETIIPHAHVARTLLSEAFDVLRFLASCLSTRWLRRSKASDKSVRPTPTSRMFIRHRHGAHFSGRLPTMTSQTLASTLEGFLSGSNNAVVIEDGAVGFDLGQAKYSVSGESNKCLLHLWSPERNVVRRVLDVEAKGETLRVTVQRMGQARPTRLEICRERDPRTPSAKRSARLTYQRVLERALRREFPELTMTQLSTSMDLEKSFGPIYTRGLLRRGVTGFAVLGVNRQELQSSIDAALTF